MGTGTLVHSLGAMNLFPMNPDPETFSLRGKTEDDNDEMW